MFLSQHTEPPIGNGRLLLFTYAFFEKKKKKKKKQIQSFWQAGYKTECQIIFMILAGYS